MATKKAAESTLYHLSPKGFWKKFTDNVVVNPEISSGLPLSEMFRYPPPASRPEKYSTPATKASDIAENPYWKRDVRRNYPQLSVVTQAGLSSLLIEHSKPQQVAAPTEGQEVVAEKQEELDLSAAIATVTSKNQIYSSEQLPPTLPTAYPKWVPQRAAEAPHPEFTYWPMAMYK
ncbi:NADH dehydrogenase 21 kDa subunit [Cylindrobasidium torrendii FP15055 ss-10]|uniref:NADH dehydrogenase 21 kDa subunit n=1 Tax=Cylindrobasidium torrendii FP15055 ss-10 TaxID=1314674 RepID=A0A0D7B1T2_9AGAR|nr:NADH dehydrogenase 21 kDa subunit [Cylindrobasidium torrendii FP15055 ss-10]